MRHRVVLWLAHCCGCERQTKKARDIPTSWETSLTTIPITVKPSLNSWSLHLLPIILRCFSVLNAYQRFRLPKFCPQISPTLSLIQFRVSLLSYVPIPYHLLQAHYTASCPLHCVMLVIVESHTRDSMAEAAVAHCHWHLVNSNVEHDLFI
jgi:hypothetical protein